jgi:hypothetical protein
MSTEDLVTRLSQDLKPVPASAIARRLAMAVTIGAILALAGAVLLIGARADLVQALRTGPFWMKVAYTVGLAVCAYAVVEQAARPGGGGRSWGPVGMLVGLAMTMGILEMMAAAPADRAQVWLGHSWSVCLPRIVALSAPVLAASLLVMRSLAPTRLALAGFATGIAAGGVGATAYCLACDENGVAFMATWYSLGILIVGGLGALVGPRLLRW